MTPLMIGKRITKAMSTVVEEFNSRLAPEPPNHMNIHTTSHAVPGELVYAFGPKVIKTLRLRSGMTMQILTVSAGGESHKHSFAADSHRRAVLLVYLGNTPTTFGYTDPRNNEFHYKQFTPGESFVLSSHHPFHISNIYNTDPAVFLAVNADLDWASSVTHWQHTW